jgi:hypothetical protein
MSEIENRLLQLEKTVERLLRLLDKQQRQLVAAEQQLAQQRGQ